MRSTTQDPAAESETVCAMAEAVRESSRLGRRVRRSPAGRVALAFGALVVLGTAGAAVAGGAGDVVPGAVLPGIGFDPDDAGDRKADSRDLAADEAERRAESRQPLPGQARAGRRKATSNREAALGFTTEMRRWAACVRSGPAAGCGERPRPQDFGLGGDDPREDSIGPPADAGPPAATGPP